MRSGSGVSATSREHQRVIAIDGPAAAGKSTVARLLAERLGALVFDTGALYRAVALLALRRGVRPDDAAALCRIANEARIKILPPSKTDGRLYDVWVDDEDVTWQVRGADVGAIVSQVSEHPSVRAQLLPLQRRIAASGPVVMVGRDIGTVVVPDAGLKVYLDASPRERALRRYRESQARGSTASFNEVLQETTLRDETDSARANAPLMVAPGAALIETDDLSIESVVERIESLARDLEDAAGAPLWPK